MNRKGAPCGRTTQAGVNSGRIPAPERWHFAADVMAYGTMWTRRQYRHIGLRIIPIAAALLILLVLIEPPETLLAEIAVGIPWFALVAAIVTLITSQTFLSDDESGLSEKIQSVNFLVSLLVAGISYQTVILPLFLG